MAYHSFNTLIAKELGIEQAIILQNISFWITKNMANGKNRHDGKTYTYNSYEAFSIYFPYLNRDKIQRVINSLEKNGFLESRNDLNNSSYDKTKWYTIPKKSWIYSALFDGADLHLQASKSAPSSLPVSKPEKTRHLLSPANAGDALYADAGDTTAVDDNGDGTEVAEYLLNSIISWKPNVKHTKKTVSTWSKDIDLAIRIDNRTKDELLNAIDWLHSGTNSAEFWKSNVLSGKKLRKNYDAIEAQAIKG